MPWTFAHPAAILPLRRHLPQAALVVGSISPDIGYYLGLYPLATFAHSGWGLLLACLPIGAAVLVVWHLLRRDGLQVARCALERMMRDHGLRGAVAGRRFRTTDQAGTQAHTPVAPKVKLRRTRRQPATVEDHPQNVR